MYKIKVKEKCSTLFNKNGYTIEEYSIEKLVSMAIEVHHSSEPYEEGDDIRDAEDELKLMSDIIGRLLLFFDIKHEDVLSILSLDEDQFSSVKARIDKIPDSAYFHYTKTDHLYSDLVEESIDNIPGYLSGMDVCYHKESLLDIIVDRLLSYFHLNTDTSRVTFARNIARLLEHLQMKPEDILKVLELDDWDYNHYQMTVVADTETEESWYE